MTNMHGRPTAGELLAAVREFLDGDVSAAVPESESRVRFHLRVASNVLAMVERELELAPAQEGEHGERLAALGFADEAELAAAIRNGDVDDRYDEVKDAVSATVADRLRVANPRYLPNSTQ